MTDQESHTITDDTPLADLTVGEFKALMQSILQSVATNTPQDDTDSPDDPEQPEITVRRKSLDEFMNDLNN